LVFSTILKVCSNAVSLSDRLQVNAILEKLNPNTKKKSQNQFDSEFELDVAEFLQNHGYEIETQAPESGFRIDIAIRRKHGKSGFICGIECDGAAYHSSWTARTRDCWRQGILESKGWKILRIWSTDWFRNKAIVGQQLLQNIESLANA
jgi:very-short-patch-repair endonuclease